MFKNFKSFGGSSVLIASPDILDNVLFELGTDADIVQVLRSATLNADTALTGVLVGASQDTSALAANSLIISNITADGDILIAVNDGGHSKQMLFLDGSTGITHIGKPGTLGHGLATGDAYFAGKTEFDGATYFDGVLLAGDAVTSSAQPFFAGGIPSLQAFGINSGKGSIVAAGFRNANDASRASMQIFKSRQATPGSFSILQDNDVIGDLKWVGDDGTDYRTEAASIRGVINGSPATSRLPTDIEFWTSEGVADDDVAVKMRLTKTGKLEMLNATGIVQRLAYAQIMEILGDVSFFYPLVEASGGTVSDFSPNGHTATASKDVDTWDTPPAYQGSIQVYDADGVDEEMDVADHADFSTAGAMSVIALVKLTTSANSTICGVWDAQSKREWRLYLDASGFPTFAAYDEGNAAQIGRQDQTDIGTASWHTIIATFDGATVSAGIVIYVDGVALDDANVEAGTGFANQVDSTAALDIFFNEDGSSAPENFYDGAASLIAMTKKELSADEAWNLHQICRGLANF